MTNYREIVTKVVTCKCKKNIINEHEFVPEPIPNTILGCWIINHKFKGQLNGETAVVNGTFDINVWYSYDNDTKTSVYTENFSYNDLIKLNIKEQSEGNQIIINCLKQPSVSDVKIKDNIVHIKIEKLLGVEVVGNVNVKVQVEDDFDDYEEVFDTPAEDELNINIDNINENYLDEAVNK